MEGTALIQFAFHFNPAFMLFDNPVHRGQSQPRPPARTLRGKKRLKDPPQDTLSMPQPVSETVNRIKCPIRPFPAAGGAAISTRAFVITIWPPLGSRRER